MSVAPIMEVVSRDASIGWDPIHAAAMLVTVLTPIGGGAQVSSCMERIRELKANHFTLYYYRH